MKVTITGATGFLGGATVRKLLAAGHRVHVLGRTGRGRLPATIEFSRWDGSSEPPAESLAGVDAVIHLAGEPVAQRWTSEVKARIRDSRVESTRILVSAVRGLSPSPRAFICASAIGIYGSRGDEILTETSLPGQGFLADVVTNWESTAQEAEASRIRTTRLRFGVVLGMDGALAKMLPPFRLGLGGRIGSGRQWMSWIHIEDAVRMILFALENDSIRGPVNVTTPSPVTNFTFTRNLAAALRRPAFVPVPQFGLRLLLGEMAEVILSSQRVLPKAAEAAGYRFQFSELRPALDEILGLRKRQF